MRDPVSGAIFLRPASLSCIPRCIEKWLLLSRALPVVRKENKECPTCVAKIKQKPI